ncbi:MAG TPA: hypothetical protein VFO01_15850 [Trebonia sp.]|nr:hypothetical protein [Trebonia sp.]
MVLERSLADRSMLTAGGVQFVVGCVLEGEQSIVGTGYGQEDLVELALGRPLMAALGVLDDEDHGQGQGGYHGLEYRFPSGRKSCRDAHYDPCPGRGDDDDRGQGPRCVPVSPGQPPADERFGQPAGGRLSHGTRQSLSVLAELAG